MDNTPSAPRCMAFHFLQEITNNFSTDQKLGEGTYAHVYLGTDKGGEKIAVKLLKDGLDDLDDEQFTKEYENLASVHHKNIIRLVGYCLQTAAEPLRYNGKFIMAHRSKKAFCFDYMHNGSLDSFIDDESKANNWHTRYAIIKGICKGLEYLHVILKPRMFHLDLKPANILLDENMSPKIADFGLSKLFLEERTQKTISSVGTRGYIPPEFIEHNLISDKFDVFSLGVMIIKIMGGRDCYFSSAEQSSQQFIELVHKDWMDRLQVTSVSMYNIQVRRCIEIALSCVEIDRKKRPTISEIISNLNETESTDQQEANEIFGYGRTQDFQIHLMGAGASSEEKGVVDHEPKISTQQPASVICRGVAAYFPQRVDQDDATYLQNLIKEANVRRTETAVVQKLHYRGSDDILRHVFRWDKAPYKFVFDNGLFIPCSLRDHSERPCLNLEDYVKSPFRLDTRREKEHGFIMTTLNSAWYPNYVLSGSSDTLHRYEIYAPGGILVAQTLGDRYTDDQDEVAFVYAIAPQYIRSAQVFILSNNRGIRGCERMNNNIYINTNFNPQSSPQKFLLIQNPVGAYMNQRKQICNLDVQPYPMMGDGPSNGADKDPLDDAILKHYKVHVTDVDSYIDAAFRCKDLNQAFIFMKTEYVIINYAPGGTQPDRKLHGPEYIGEGFPCLAGTAFAEYGIDAAFALLDGTAQAVIFSGNLCARIYYTPFRYETGFIKESGFVKAPKPIREMFPCLKGTKFAEGIDCAFATKGRNAYLFKGTEYALIDHVNGILIATRPIKNGFDGLENNGFAGYLDAAFATHKGNEVYLFKANMYLKLGYIPGSMGDKVIITPRTVTMNWRSLADHLPRKNIAVDQLPVPQGYQVPERRGRYYI